MHTYQQTCEWHNCVQRHKIFDLSQVSAPANATTELQHSYRISYRHCKLRHRCGISTVATAVRCQPGEDKVSGARMEPRVCAKHGARRLSAQPYIHSHTHTAMSWLLLCLPDPMTPHRRWVERARAPCCLFIRLQGLLACYATRAQAHNVNKLNNHQQVSKNRH